MMALLTQTSGAPNHDHTGFPYWTKPRLLTNSREQLLIFANAVRPRPARTSVSALRDK